MSGRGRRLLYVLWLLGAASLWLFENNTGTRATLALSLLVPFACTVAAALSRVQGRLSLPREIRTGDMAAGTAEFTGAPFASVHVEAERICSLTGESQSLILGEGSFQLIPRDCGLVQVIPRACLVQDLFGLAAFRRPLPEGARMLVLPNLYEVQLSPEMLGRLTGEDGQGLGQGFPGAELRPYVPGDPVSLIHWKLTEKTREVLVRRREGQDWPMLLFYVPEERRDMAGAALTAMLSLARTLCQMSQSLTLLWQGPEGPCAEGIEGRDGFERAARTLTAQCRCGGDLEALLGAAAAGPLMLFGAEMPPIGPHREDCFLVLTAKETGPWPVLTLTPEAPILG